MSSGLLALLDDIAALAKITAVTLDDTAALTVKASAKSIGLVVDDAAVTPRYVIGFASDRELPIIRKIAIGSLKNKLLFLLPGAIILGWIMPWLITPILMLGACYLCFEGYEKIHEYFFSSSHAATLPEVFQAAGQAGQAGQLVEQFERERVQSAIRTDFILSAEIMAIAFATVSQQPIIKQVVVLLGVSLGITALVYGLVALIVRADDFGLYLAQKKGKAASFLRPAGRAIVRAMPPFLKGLSVVGTLAMLYVGGGILVHSLTEYDLRLLERIVHIIPYGSAFMTVLAGTAAGFLATLCVSPVQGLLRAVSKKRKASSS